MGSSPCRISRPRRSLVLLTVAIVATAHQRRIAQPVLYVVNEANNTIGAYNAATGATINAAFVNGQGLNDPAGLVMDNNNHLFVTNANNNTVGQYNATTGATINAAFVNGQGLNTPDGLALDGNNHLLAVGAAVGQYNATTGATINSAFISGPQIGIPVGIALDSHNQILLANGPGGVIGEYNATTGATINASFVSGLHDPDGIALDTLGHLFVTEITNVVAECDTVTGVYLIPTSSPA